MSTPWLLVAGDLTPLGGMDAANHALARYLGRGGAEVHVVTHRAWSDLAELPGITVHRVWRPFNRHVLGGPLLSRAGSRLWRRLGPRGARAVVNGGNCQVAAANWVHYLHAAYNPAVNGSATRRLKGGIVHRHDLEAEKRALESARVIICNSQRTRRDVIERLGIPPDRVHVVYYGTDPARFGAVEKGERQRAKEQYGRAVDRPLVGFVGALGDRRKAFDTVFEAWKTLCLRSDWDADLLVIGSGAEEPVWRERAREARLASRIKFLGFRRDVPDVLAALDALVHPSRYEAYGLSVHEALCRGLPAFVSRSAGVAERYPSTLTDLLIENPDNGGELADRLFAWRQDIGGVHERVAPVAEALRSRTWDAMASEIVERVEQSA